MFSFVPVSLLVAAVAAVASAGSLPSYMHACSSKDPELNQCIEKVIRTSGQRFAAGIPELGIAPLDPVELGTVQVDNPALKLTFFDTVVSGLGGFQLNSFKINQEKGKAALDFTANVTLKGRYEMDGQILILPIRGNGQAKIKITNLNVVVKYDYSTKNGHWVVDSYKESYKMDHAHFKFTNLFNGNKQLAETTLTFLNQNWQIIMQEIAPPAIEQIIQRCVGQVGLLYAAVPADQLLLP